MQVVLEIDCKVGLLLLFCLFFFLTENLEVQYILDSAQCKYKVLNKVGTCVTNAV